MLENTFQCILRPPCYCDGGCSARPANAGSDGPHYTIIDPTVTKIYTCGNSYQLINSHINISMSYKHDIFVSYRRNPETLRWIKQHFLPLLSLRVEFELNRPPIIFVDEQLESGISWPLQLGKELGRSRILIALWTGNYLSSIWCTAEISNMMARERETKRRTIDNPRGLIIPAVIHDGEQFPDSLKDIQRFEIQKCFNVRMGTDSPLAEKLDGILMSESPAIAKAIREAPPWRSNWPNQAAKNLYILLHQTKPAQQKRLPRYTSR